MPSEISIITGRGGGGGGIGGSGGDVHIHYGSESDDTTPLMFLPRAMHAGHDSGHEAIPSCLEGTRVAILKDILSWSESADGERSPVYWLSGLAGIGKSSIAKTVADRAQRRATLGASFFFARSDETLRDPALVFPTLAFQLAQSDDAFKNAIAEALRYDPMAGHRELRSQLHDLILAPLLKIRPVRRPVLIILDALDECEEMGSAQILQLVCSYAVRIPFLRILITSRPHPHLSAVFSHVPNLEKTVLHDVEASVIQQDIRFYISTELAKIPQNLGLRIPANWAPQDQINALVERSGNLFLYAASVVRFIGDRRVGDPPAHLRCILDPWSAQEVGAAPYLQLDDLYKGVLRQSLSTYNHPEILKRFQTIVGSLVLLREPLPLHSLARFVGYETHVVKDILRPLHSVILSSSDVDNTARIYHPSFLEFITDASRCSMTGFVIVRMPGQELRHALRCFELMATHLKRDLAGISDVSPRVEDIDGFEQKVREALPPEAQYACRYWASHLSCVEFGENKTVEVLEAFSMHSILWWFEAMSLIGGVAAAVISIQEAHRWATKSKCKSILVTILCDAYRFILAYRETIIGNALYVYEAFIPNGTVLSKTYHEHEWPSTLTTLHGHSHSVLAVAFSPNGFNLASGSRDCTLGLWDAKSGGPIAKLEGHSGSVRSIAFSPDALCLVSGSDDCTLWLWDAMSGKPIAKLEGHSASVRTVTFSPDGLHLASGSDDHSLLLWDARSTTLIAKLEGHSASVRAVTFSPDGLHLASGSDDHTLQLWDARSGAPIRKLKGHSDAVRTVAFSPDAFCLVSGSDDHTLQLWDAISGVLIRQLKGHSDAVRTVAFSPDALYLVSASNDGTLQLWEGISGKPIQKLEGHSGSVRTVAFSPNGLHLVSGSDDCTLQLWDVSGKLIETLEGHSGSVRTVAFSPDGLHLVSGSDDHTLRLWDAASVVPVANLEGYMNVSHQATLSSSNAQPDPTGPPNLTGCITRLGLEPMATGGYSSVWRGSLPFATPNDPNKSLQVAIKVLRSPNTDEHSAKQKLYKHLHSEMHIWAQLHHDNVVTLLGHTQEPEGPGLVSMVYPHSNVLNFLVNNSNVNREVLCADVALGLQYLHEHDPPIIHGDLKGPNVLINSEGKASICDFGLSIILDGGPTGFTSSNFTGTLRFLAPELLDDSTRTVQTDIYAYACTCIQILFDREPYHQISKDGPLMRAILEHQPPYEPSNEEVTFPGLFEILKDCWNHDQSSRPSSDLIIGTIQQYLYRTYQANAIIHQGIGRRLRFIGVPGVEQAKLSSVADDGLSIIADCSSSFRRIPIYQRYRWEWLNAQDLEPRPQDSVLSTSSLSGKDASSSESRPYISEWGDYSMKFRLACASRVSYETYDEVTSGSV